MIDRYMSAFEHADIDALTRLLTDDAILEMPPVRNWYIGRDGYGGFIARVYADCGTDWRLVPTSANGRPAVAAYRGMADGAYHTHTLWVFTVTKAGISRNTSFPASLVFPLFGQPEVLGGAGA
jgi:RNA polymerase sigma-70 factor (ECF subfamily)